MQAVWLWPLSEWQGKHYTVNEWVAVLWIMTATIGIATSGSFWISWQMKSRCLNLALLTAHVIVLKAVQLCWMSGLPETRGCASLKCWKRLGVCRQRGCLACLSWLTLTKRYTGWNSREKIPRHKPRESSLCVFWFCFQLSHFALTQSMRM